MKLKFFNSETSIKFKLITSIIGVIIFALSYYFADKIISINKEDLLQYIILIIFCASGLFLGSIMIVANLNFQNNWIRSSLLIIFGVLVGICFFDVLTRTVILTLISELIVLFILFLFFRIYSTITTLVISFYIYFFVLIVIQKLSQINFTINPSIFLYTILTLFLIFYQIVGVRLNKFFIAKVMNKRKIAEEYTYNILKSHINLIYILIFIVINVSGLIYEQSDDNFNFSNVLNNCFLTSIALNQIDWKKLKY